MTAPDPATVVMNEVFPPGPAPADTILLYDGATQAKNGFTPWKSWDIRGWLNRLVWDLLRFQVIDTGKPNPDRTVPYGLRDTITAIWYLADQNNQLLIKLLAAAGTPTNATAKTIAEATAHQEAFTDTVRAHLTAQEQVYRNYGVAEPGLLKQAGLHVTV